MHIIKRGMEQRMIHVLHGSILLQMSLLHQHVIHGQQKIFRSTLIIYPEENARIAYQTAQAPYMKQENQPRHSWNVTILT